MNNTITHPIGTSKPNTAAIVRDHQLLKRVWQNMQHESDKMKIELARRSNSAKVLNLHQ